MGTTWDPTLWKRLKPLNQPAAEMIKATSDMACIAACKRNETPMCEYEIPKLYKAMVECSTDTPLRASQVLAQKPINTQFRILSAINP